MPIISGRDNENSRWTLFSLSLTLTIGIFHCFNYTLLLLHLITTHLVRLVLFSLCLFWFFLLLLFAFLFHLLFPISLTLIISIFYCLNYTLLLVHLITTHLVPLALFCLWLFFFVVVVVGFCVSFSSTIFIISDANYQHLLLS